MPSDYRSSITTQGRRMAGARALWRATGMKTEDFLKPVVAIANSFTQFVPGHVHLHPIGQRVKQVVDAAGGYGVEFNTIAVDDGIAMGHDGMLYSLPSRELIADSVEYMVNAHKADALVCISNCDKITPGMLLAALRLNLPTIFVSGGPMEAGREQLSTGPAKLDLVDSMVAAGDDRVSDEELEKMEAAACPTCGSCSGMFTANSMNCLNEAIGLALPGNGTVLATHQLRWSLFERAGGRIVEMAQAYYRGKDSSVLPRSIATFEAFENAMSLDIAMGGPPTRCCTCWPWPGRPASTSPWPTSTACRARCRASARWRRRRRSSTWRTWPAPGASPRSWGSCSGPASCTPGRARSPAAPWAT